jgi:hypothetical protein
VRDDDMEKKMLAIEAMVHGISMAAKIIKGTNLDVGDLLLGQVAIWCSGESGATQRAEEFGKKLVETVHSDMANGIVGQQKMFALFQEEGVEVKYRH